MRRNCPINTFDHFSAHRSLLVVFVPSLMESSAVSEIMSQLQLLTDGMVSIHQDVDMLKRANLIQRNTSEEVVDTGIADEMADESIPLSNQLLSHQHSSWAEEMDIRDPQLDDDNPMSEINVVPVTEHTNKFLTEAFMKKIPDVDRRKLRSHRKNL